MSLIDVLLKHLLPVTGTMIITHSCPVNCVGDILDKLGRHPVLANEAVVMDVNIEHVEMMVDGFHLTHFAQPHVNVT